MTAARSHTNNIMDATGIGGDASPSGMTMTARLATAYAELMRGFFAACRRWAADHIARPDEENWFALWMPSSASQIG